MCVRWGAQRAPRQARALTVRLCTAVWACARASHAGGRLRTWRRRTRSSSPNAPTGSRPTLATNRVARVAAGSFLYFFWTVVVVLWSRSLLTFPFFSSLTLAYTKTSCERCAHALDAVAMAAHARPPWSADAFARSIGSFLSCLGSVRSRRAIGRPAAIVQATGRACGPSPSATTCAHPRPHARSRASGVWRLYMSAATPVRPEKQAQR